MEQRTPEWHEARRGKVTASRIGDLMARTKSGRGASSKNYQAELICERLTGETAPHHISGPMQWGIDHEEEAVAAYAFFQDTSVEKVGFIDHPTIEMSGASPDGRSRERGLVEIKCPNSATHLDALLGAKIKRQYLLQMMWQMACTGAGWCDFISFDPRLPAALQLSVTRVERDDALIVEIEDEVKKFLAELDHKVAELEARCPMSEAAE